jgi:hypothetical protein
MYGLLKPVGRSVSLLAAFFGLAGVASGAAVSLTRLAPLVLLGGGQYLTALTTSQLQSLAYVFLRLQAQGSNVPGVLLASAAPVTSSIRSRRFWRRHSRPAWLPTLSRPPLSERGL